MILLRLYHTMYPFELAATDRKENSFSTNIADLGSVLYLTYDSLTHSLTRPQKKKKGIDYHTMPMPMPIICRR